MLKKKWVFFIPVVVAILVLIALKKNTKEPPRSPAKERATLVRVISVPSVSVIPQATGYGTVQPSSNWSAIAQVKGKVIYKQPKLKKGAFINAETIIIKIDPTDYELSLAQSQADIAATKAQLAELQIKEKNTRLSLAIEQRALKLTEKELQRQKKLVNKGGISFSDVEKQERNLLSQQQIVQNQHNTLNLLPTQQALLDAQLLRQQTQIQSLQRDLAHTHITLPFSGRVAEVNIEENQYIREGELLTTIDSLDKAEIEVQLPLNDLRSILNSNKHVNAQEISSDQRQRHLGLKAQVALKIGDERLYWKADFSRMSDSLDPKTRTVGVIVEVDKPYANVRPGIRPPLVKGLFVEVILTGKVQHNSIIVPNSAIHNSDQSKQKLVYVVNDQGRLETRPVTIKLTQDEYSIINSGLQADEVIILSELLPAIDNMLLTVQKDEQMKQRLIKNATYNNFSMKKPSVSETEK
jgi:RND family efflux transporter MFP subunit